MGLRPPGPRCPPTSPTGDSLDLCRLTGLMVMRAGAVKYGLVQNGSLVVFGEPPGGLAERIESAGLALNKKSRCLSKLASGCEFGFKRGSVFVSPDSPPIQSPPTNRRLPKTQLARFSSKSRQVKILPLARGLGGCGRGAWGEVRLPPNQARQEHLVISLTLAKSNARLQAGVSFRVA